MYKTIDHQLQFSEYVHPDSYREILFAVPDAR